MSMALKSRRELYKLRELVHFLLAGAGSTPREHVWKMGDVETPSGPNMGAYCCFFCKKALEVSRTAGGWLKHGNAVGPRLEEKITIHHIDGNHDNDEPLNKSLCHTTCHKSFHRRIANEERELRKRLEQQGEKLPS